MRLTDKYQKLLILLLLLLACCYFLYLVRGILLPFLIAGLIAYLVNPLIEKLLPRGFTRLGAIILLMGMLFAVSLIFGVFGLPLIIEELNTLSDTLPVYVKGIQQNLDRFYQDLQRIKLPTILKQVADQSLQKAEQAGIEFLNRLTEMILKLISRIMSLSIAPIIAFYILKDYEILSRNLQGLIPKRYRKEMFQLWVEVNTVVSGFLRGQFLVSLLIAALSIIGLTILRVNFAIVLGAIAGAFNVIPYLGPILGAIPAVAIELIKSPIRAAGVAILFVVIQQIESGFVSPRIVGDKVGLHPITVIFVVLAGGQIGGVVGMIIAVPVAGVVKVALKFIAEKMAE